MSNISINYINYDWLKYFKYFNGVNTSDYSVTSESWEHSCNLLMTHPVHCSTLYPAMINMIEQSQLCVWPGSINIFSNYILILSSESWQLCILTVAGVRCWNMMKSVNCMNSLNISHSWHNFTFLHSISWVNVYSEYEVMFHFYDDYLRKMNKRIFILFLIYFVLYILGVTE